MEEQLSQSTLFQALTGAADATAALGRIRLFSCVEAFAEEEEQRGTGVVLLPRACIFLTSARGERTTTSNPTVEIGIGVEIVIAMPSSVDRTHDAEIRYAGPKFEEVFDDVMKLSAPSQPGGALNVVRYNVIQPPYPEDPDKYVDADGDQVRAWVCATEFTVAG
jgi:hypothetical protein